MRDRTRPVAERRTHGELPALDGRYGDFWRERTRARGWTIAAATGVED